MEGVVATIALGLLMLRLPLLLGAVIWLEFDVMREHRTQLILLLTLMLNWLTLLATLADWLFDMVWRQGKDPTPLAWLADRVHILAWLTVA